MCMKKFWVFFAFVILLLRQATGAGAASVEVLENFADLQAPVENEIGLQTALDKISSGAEEVEMSKLGTLCLAIARNTILSSGNRVRALRVLGKKDIRVARSELLKFRGDPEFFKGKTDQPLEDRRHLEMNLHLVIFQLQPIEERQDHDLIQYLSDNLKHVREMDFASFLQLLRPSFAGVEFLNMLIGNFSSNQDYRYAGFLEALIAGIETQTSQASFDLLQRLAGHTRDISGDFHKRVRAALLRSVNRRLHDCSEDLRRLLSEW